MVDGKKLAEAGFIYIGVSYSKMDCQAFVEQCLRDCGLDRNLAGSNAWFREVMQHGAVMTPEECVRELGTVPPGAFLFILKHDGGEPAKYKADGLGNASHIGIVTGRGEGAIHSSSSRGCVCESKFKNKTIANGGWNMVGLYDKVIFDYGSSQPSTQTLVSTGDTSLPILRKGSKGEYVSLIQTKLIMLGYDLGSYGADGDFGNKTMEAVMKFQADRGLVPDGIVGPATWNEFNNGTTGGDLYTVQIPHLKKTEVEDLKVRYPSLIYKKE